MKPRLGPLGTPVVLIVTWIAVRVAISAPWATMEKFAAGAPPELVVTRSDFNLSVERGPATVVTHRAGNVFPAWLVHTRAHPEQSSPPIAHTSVAGPADPPQVFALPPPADPIANGRYPQLRRGLVDADFVPRRTRYHALTGSAWELVNGAGGAVGVPSLGGSQLGARLFLQGARTPVGLTGRISRALGAHDVEVSAGYALRGHGLGLLVERRQRLDVRNGAFVVTGYGGAYDVKLPAGARFDGFAQAGVAGVHSRRWFGDAQARVTKRGEIYPGVSLGAGGGAWASAQYGARRVEVGPLVEMRVRAATTGMRVAWEYRLRVTGDAKPRSGPALTVGLDF